MWGQGGESEVKIVKHWKCSWGQTTGDSWMRPVNEFREAELQIALNIQVILEGRFSIKAAA